MDINPEIKNHIKEWIYNPAKAVWDLFGVEPTAQQKELLDSFGRRDSNSYAVRSGHGCGKSAVLAWLAIIFLLTRPMSKVVATAPTKRQIKDILWSEISFWVGKGKLFVRQLIDIHAERIKVGGREDWWARAVSINLQATPEEQAETLAGIHAKHLLVLVDEASGVPEPVFLPIEGYLTNPDNYVILTGNPTRTTGYFWKVFNVPTFGKGWKLVHWNSEDSPLVSKQWLNRMRDRYGRDSDTYRIRVLGEFPRGGKHELIPKEWIDRNLVSKDEIFISHPIIWGIDPAGMGGDEIGFAKRTPMFLFDIKGKPFLEQDEILDWVIEEYNKDDKEGNYPDYVIIDISGGYGSGLAERLRSYFDSKKTKVFGVHFGWSAHNKDSFSLLRDELWWRLREQFEFNMLKIIKDEILINQLTMVKYLDSETGRVKIMSKKKMPESPDRAEALVLTTFITPSHAGIRPYSKPKRKKRTRRSLGWKVA